MRIEKDCKWTRHSSHGRRLRRCKAAAVTTRRGWGFARHAVEGDKTRSKTRCVIACWKHLLFCHEEIESLGKQHHSIVCRLIMSPAASFDPSKAYAQQEEVFFNDGREAQLLHHVQSRPDIEKLRGSPQKVLAAIDEFGRQEKYLMNIGEDKGAIVTKVIRETQPKVMVRPTHKSFYYTHPNVKLIIVTG